MARAAKTTRQRPTRSTAGRRNVLTVEGRDDDFVYRVVNDTPGRVADMKDRGYEIAEGEEKFSSSLDDSSSAGSVKSKHVGGGVNGVLMRIPKEWYEEDQKEKVELSRKAEQQLKTNNIKGGYGTVKIE